MNVLSSETELALKLKDDTSVISFPLYPHEAICYIAQVIPAEVHHIYWIVRPPKAEHSLFDKGSQYSNFNEPPERMRRRSCLLTGAELCGQVQSLNGTAWAVRACLLHLLFQLLSMRAFFISLYLQI